MMFRWLLLFLLGSCMLNPAYACDLDFIQEPTTRDPEMVIEDTDKGFVYLTYTFIDDRTLVVVYQTRDFLLGPEQHPLFYVVTGKDHVSIIYIDKEGHGNCYAIERY